MSEKEPPIEFQKKHALRLSDKDGKFVSQFPGEVGKGFSIGYLEELCEYTFFNEELDVEEKEKRILGIEDIIRNILRNPKNVGGSVTYNPTWSIKLKK